MVRILLLTALRNLRRHKLQSLINVASLALGLAVFAFALLYVKQQLGYNRGWPDAARIHRLIAEVRGMPGLADARYDRPDGRSWSSVTEYFADEIESASRTHRYSLHVRTSEEPREITLVFADAGFGDIFDLDVIAGDIDRVLNAPRVIALEEAVAARLGTDIAPGTRLTLIGQRDDLMEFEVGAIYRLPANRSQALEFPALTLIHDSVVPLFGAVERAPWDAAAQIWLKLRPGITTKAFNALQPAYIDNTVTGYDEMLGPERNVANHFFFHWQPLREIYFNPVGFEANTAGDPVRVATFAIVGLLVLLVGCSNSASLSLASAIERRREIGIRKAVGAQRRDVIVQHLGESVLLALIALVPAIALLEGLLPAFQTLLPFRVVLAASLQEYALLAAIAVAVGLANGVYPALVLSAVRPQAVLKPGTGGGVKAGQTVRTLLVGVQFCFASMLLIGTAMLYVQLAIARAQPLGFNPANLVFIYFGDGLNADNAQALNNELEKIPGVLGINNGFTLPSANTNANSMVLVNKAAGSGEVNAQSVPANHDFFDMMEISLLAGRGFEQGRDDPPTQTAEAGAPQPEVTVLLNRAATRALGFATPEAAVGELIHRRLLDARTDDVTEIPLRIIGVAEDNLYGTMRRRPGPEIYMNIAATVPYRMVKYEAAVEGALQQRFDDLSRQMFGAPAQAVIFLEPIVAGAYQRERNEGKLLLISGGIALLLACIGLYGLAAFTMERRTKEVGVRKVMGASVGTLLALFLWRFSRPVLLANVLAWPVSIYFVLQWIERFPYQLDKAWLLPLCLGATLAVLLVALLTAGFITLRAASASPVKALRYE